jgi:hypothetical protein
MTGRWLGIIVTAAAVGCGGQHASSVDFEPVPPARAAEMEASVRAFAQAVADDVSHGGPAGWRAHFADSPAFFMAADGELVFPTIEAATSAVDNLTRNTRRIVFRWGEPMRVDPVAAGIAMLAGPYSETRIDIDGRRIEESGYFTALVEHRNDRWRLRNVHWSMAGHLQASP